MTHWKYWKMSGKKGSPFPGGLRYDLIGDGRFFFVFAGNK